MSKVYSQALNQELEIDRLIGYLGNQRQEGPVIVFFGGVHGNEPSGVFALDMVLKRLKSLDIPVNGHLYAIAGNLWALKRGERFEKKDLNRLWTRDHVSLMESSNGSYAKNHDEKEQVEIYTAIQKLLRRHQGPFYFVDLHTTSSETIPFMTVNDAMINRKFTAQYPVPTILGIEEFLDGPLLSYINELGYVAFGFEAGQHDDLSSIENHEAFIYLTMVFSSFIAEDDIPNYEHYYGVLAKNSVITNKVYEIKYRHQIIDGDTFKMKKGFVNFQKIHEGDFLANSNGLDLKATYDGRIFMPLYQNQGEDGYFIIKKVSKKFLRLSAWLRRLTIDQYLIHLPGIRRYPKDPTYLKVNTKVVRYYAKSIFHLFGYRTQRFYKENYLLIKNREKNARKESYKQTTWY